MSILTLSHEAFGDGRAVAERVAAILGHRCISREVLVKANERYGISEAKLSEVLEEKRHHWWSNGLRAAGFIGSRSRQRYVSSRKSEILCTTAVPVRSFSPASVTCSMFSWILRGSQG